MISPFSTFEEFSEAEGPIYTFANNPGMITLLLLLCAAIALYFLYSSFTMRQDRTMSPVALSLLLIAGTVSLLSMPFQPTQSEARRPQTERQANWQPLALLGMLGTGRSMVDRKRRTRRVRR